MSEQDNKPKQQEEKKDGVRHNWVTDIYDKMDISVRSLDIALIVLCAIVVFCFIYGANHYKTKMRIILKKYFQNP